MEFKGTKGEWKFDGIGKDLYMVSSDLEVQGNIICIIPDSEYEESRVNWECNAQLIAAAPELLEALIKVSKINKVAREYISEDLFKEVDKAINKALGL